MPDVVIFLILSFEFSLDLHEETLDMLVKNLFVLVHTNIR